MSMSARLDRQASPTRHEALHPPYPRSDVHPQTSLAALSQYDFCQPERIVLRNRPSLVLRKFELKPERLPEFTAPIVASRCLETVAKLDLPEKQPNLAAAFECSPLGVSIGADSIRFLPNYTYVPSPNRKHSPEKLVLLRKISNMVNYGKLPRATAFKLQVAIDHMKRGRLDLDAVGLSQAQFKKHCRRHFKDILQDYKTTHRLARVNVAINGNVKTY
ncbi:MAG: hypothetical protein JWR21_1696 [Herminiimonas sp.]|nr:hypothetical protein [Herminiimonas sp.]MDB5853637.1 hypothetical protein [Herminiimonas sp.]